MKEYTTLEMIEEIMKDKILKFKSIGGVVYVNKHSVLTWEKYDSLEINETTINYKWTKVQQPVHFIEAAKAFHKGKIIKVDYQNGKATNTYDPHKNGTLTDNHGGGITTDEILEGTWYIEE